MPPILHLAGSAALSAFRLEKLQASLHRTSLAGARITTRYWHFVELERSLSDAERGVLDRLLSYGPSARPEAEGETLLVVPRIGTISPWSSKATDIATHCGLHAVTRIERGIVFHVARRGSALDESERATLLPLIHDRMTETVLATLEEADRLFHHFEPKPLATIDLLGGGRAALEAANRAMGLALSADEIDYLH